MTDPNKSGEFIQEGSEKEQDPLENNQPALNPAGEDLAKSLGRDAVDGLLRVVSSSINPLN